MSLAFDNTHRQPQSQAIPAETAGFSPKTPQFDCILADAFRSMEEKVCDLSNAGVVLSMLMDSLLGSAGSENDDLKFELTRKQWETLFYAMFQVVNQADDLRSDYMGAYDRLKTVGTA